jgi:MFS transporter, PAT family, beta-lactamase induction signal transducer AmpG
MVGLEQFGYGFGFTAFLMYMMWFAEGLNKTSHYALATGFMALGMMLPGMVSGWLQTIMGYQLFFIWVTVCTIPGFILIKHLNIDASFGKRQST